MAVLSASAADVQLRGAPELPRGFLSSKLPEDWRDVTARLRCATVNLGGRGLTREIVQKVSAEYPLAVWTVNEASRARELLSWGAASIITDDPHLAVV
ncbi:MAG: glycerophosphodiester phosphodiesterase family protein [Elsteraceae bacterium]